MKFSSVSGSVNAKSPPGGISDVEMSPRQSRNRFPDSDSGKALRTRSVRPRQRGHARKAGAVSLCRLSIERHPSQFVFFSLLLTEWS